jgi:hypothetical protein
MNWIKRLFGFQKKVVPPTRTITPAAAYVAAVLETQNEIAFTDIDLLRMGICPECGIAQAHKANCPTLSRSLNTDDCPYCGQRKWIKSLYRYPGNDMCNFCGAPRPRKKA